MLKHLFIRNYALFSEVSVAFDQGLSVITGETGAGKSMLIGALGLITGKRADSTVVFDAGKKCIVEARFGDLPQSMFEQLKAYEDFDMAHEDLDMNESEILIRREINPSGKSRSFINDTPVSLQVLRQVSNILLDMHSQHENHHLLSHDKQLELLDSFAGCEGLVKSFEQEWRASEALLTEIKELEEKERTAKQQLEFYTFQLEELSAASIETDEEDRLTEELNLLQNSEEVREALGGANESIYNQDNSLYVQLSTVLEPLKKVSGVNKSLAEEVERLESVREALKDAAYSFSQMLETVTSDPERLAFIEERLAIYHGLKLKFNAVSGEDLMRIYEEVQGKVQEFDSLEENIRLKKDAYDKLIASLLKLGLQLESKRLKAGKELSSEVDQMLGDVGFKQAFFRVQIDRSLGENSRIELEGEKLKAGPRGFNKAQFMIRTNPGMPEGALSQIASGGEISRVMLAIKAALAERADFPVLIFDEIDAGISGEIALKVGNVMQRLSQRFQILSITHLPQIASKGRSHYRIQKQIIGENTSSNVTELQHDERVVELAQMLSGAEPTPSALKNAAELLDQAS
ncbi:MAG: DNA repair protein RecN [Bacteroidota bacterium]